MDQRLAARMHETETMQKKMVRMVTAEAVAVWLPLGSAMSMDHAKATEPYPVFVDKDRYSDHSDAHNRRHHPHDGVGHHRGYQVSNGHQSREGQQNDDKVCDLGGSRGCVDPGLDDQGRRNDNGPDEQGSRLTPEPVPVDAENGPCRSNPDNHVRRCHAGRRSCPDEAGHDGPQHTGLPDGDGDVLHLPHSPGP